MKDNNKNIHVDISTIEINVGIDLISKKIDENKISYGDKYFIMKVEPNRAVRIFCTKSDKIVLSKEDRWVLEQAGWVLTVDKQWSYTIHDRSAPVPRRA